MLWAHCSSFLELWGWNAEKLYVTLRCQFPALVVQIVLSFVTGKTTSPLFMSLGSSRVTKPVISTKENGAFTTTTSMPEETTSKSSTTAATISFGSASDFTVSSAAQSAISFMGSTMLSSTLDMQSSPTIITTQLVSSTLSQCSVGFITCKDGRCEPFESLCGAAGAVTAASTSAMSISTMSQTTSTSPAVSVPVTGQSSALSLYESTPVTPTPTKQEVTTTLGGPVPGPEVCLPGWEDCKDGSCEPFHWLCVEHQAQAIVGR